MTNSPLATQVSPATHHHHYWLLEAWLGQTIWSHPVRGRTHAGPEDWVTASTFVQLGRVVLEWRELSWSHLGSALSSLSALLPQPQSPQILNVE